MNATNKYQKLATQLANTPNTKKHIDSKLHVAPGGGVHLGEPTTESLAEVRVTRMKVTVSKDGASSKPANRGEEYFPGWYAVCAFGTYGNLGEFPSAKEALKAWKDYDYQHHAVTVRMIGPFETQSEAAAIDISSENVPGIETLK